jgi:competence protein ComEA
MTDRSAEASDDALDLLAPGSRRTPRGARMRIGVGAAVAILVVALVVTVALSMIAPHGSTSPVPSVSAETARGADASTAPTASAPSSAALFVHVLGAVNAPGLYELHTGSRVIDAVSAAGGFTAEADQGGVNLARVLSDGEQLQVPVVGQVPPPGSVAVPGTTAPGGAGVAAAGAKVDLNTASEAELETLPRVGPAMAARILAWRSENGRFTSVDDLMDISGIGDKTFEALKDLVTV